MKNQSDNLIKESADALKASADLHVTELKNSFTAQMGDVVKKIIFSICIYGVLAITALHLSYQGLIYLLSLVGVPDSFQNIYLSGIAFLLAALVIIFQSFDDPSKRIRREKREKLEKIAAFNRDVKNRFGSIRHNLLNPVGFVEAKMKQSFHSRNGLSDIDWLKFSGLLAGVIGGLYLIFDYFKGDRPEKVRRNETGSKKQTEPTQQAGQVSSALKGLLVAAATSLLKEFQTELFTVKSKPNRSKEGYDISSVEKDRLDKLKQDLETAH